MTATDHGPTCIACHNPDEARRQLATDRTELDTQAARAAAHRQAGEAAREEYYRQPAGSPAFYTAQDRMTRELGTANAIAQGVMMRRAHLDRVEAAHPALTADAAESEQLTLGGAA